MSLKNKNTAKFKIIRRPSFRKKLAPKSNLVILIFVVSISFEKTAISITYLLRGISIGYEKDLGISVGINNDLPANKGLKVFLLGKIHFHILYI